MEFKMRNWYAQWVDDWWAGDIFAIALSCTLVAALCGTLSAFDGHQAPTFGTVLNHGITLSTLVTLLSTFSAASGLIAVQSSIQQLKWLWCLDSTHPLSDLATFDEASRGLQGSMKLIWKLRGSLVASLGAFLVIIQLAVPPLAQQSLQYRADLAKLQTGNASVPIATNWIESSQQVQSTDIPVGYDSLAPGLKGAIINGLFTPTTSIVPGIIPSCSSGNCTFAPYHSLAICASQTDVTTHLKYNLSEHAAQECLPGGHCLSNKDTFYSANMTSAANLDAILAPWEPDSENRGQQSSLNFTSVAFADHQNPIADVYVIYKNVTDFINNNDYLGVEFMFDWCIATFNTSVTNGTATTTRIASPPAVFGKNGTSLSTVVDGITFNVGLKTHYTLQRYMALLLSGTVSNRGGVQQVTSSDAVNVVAQALGLNSDDRDSDSSPNQDRNPVSLTVLLENTATSMTNYICGAQGTASIRQAEGTVWVQQSTVVIRWGWLVAPIAFSVISLIFFLIVFVQSNHHKPRTPQWKASSFATIHSLEPALRTRLGGMTEQSTMSQEAETIYVRLTHTNDGWSLVEAPHLTECDTQYVALEAYKPST